MNLEFHTHTTYKTSTNFDFINFYFSFEINTTSTVMTTTRPEPTTLTTTRPETTILTATRPKITKTQL